VVRSLGFICGGRTSEPSGCVNETREEKIKGLLDSRIAKGFLSQSYALCVGSLGYVAQIKKGPNYLIL
jgi:hypothetical protein